MKFIPNQLAACAGIAAMSAVSLFAVAPHAQRSSSATMTPAFVGSVETVLGMTPNQKDQARTAFDQARQQAQPVQQELSNTRKSLEAAIRSDNTAEIQRLSTVEGQEFGQLAAIRSAAVAKVYKTLTPDQRTKAEALHNLLMPQMRRNMSERGARAAS